MARLACLTLCLTLGAPETRMDTGLPRMPRATARPREARAHAPARVQARTRPRVRTGAGMLGMLGAPMIYNVFFRLTQRKKARQGVGRKEMDR